MTFVKEEIVSVRKSVFTCNCCQSDLDYVQLLTDNFNVGGDFFECPVCLTRIDSISMQSEVGEFYD